MYDYQKHVLCKGTGHCEDFQINPVKVTNRATITNAAFMSVLSVVCILVMDKVADLCEGKGSMSPGQLQMDLGEEPCGSPCEPRAFLRGDLESVGSASSEMELDFQSMASSLRTVMGSFGVLVGICWNKAFETAYAVILEHDSWSRMMSSNEEAKQFLEDNEIKGVESQGVERAKSRVISMQMQQSRSCDFLIKLSGVKAAPKWTFRGKPHGEILTDTPGPGQYYGEAVKLRTRGTRPRKTRRLLAPPRLRPSTSPGPGEYSVDNQKLSGSQYGFGTSVRHTANGRMNSSPGPGSYNQSPRLGEGPKYTASGKRGGYKASEVPGPGAYTAVEGSIDLTSSSTRLPTRAPQWGFGTSTREGQTSNQTPGPGSYDGRGLSKGSPKYSMRPKDSPLAPAIHAALTLGSKERPTEVANVEVFSDWKNWDDDTWFRDVNKRHEDRKKQFFNSEALERHHYHAGAAAAGGMAVFITCIWFSCFFSIVCCPCCLLCRGHLKARGLREKLEHLQLAHPPHAERQSMAQLPDGMMRLAQEDRILIKEKVQDLQAMLGMNLAGALGAMGVDAANAYAGRDKAPFRMCVGLPPLGGGAGGKPGVMQVTVPEGVSSGQQIQVTSPTGVGPGQTMEVHLPSKNQGPSMQTMMEGLVPGAATNNDTPFLYLDRPFAIDCCCVNRPKVDVFDCRGGAMVKLGIISDPFAWMDMTFGIHIGPNASESDVPALWVRGAACQPGATCTLCGLCCGRSCQEAYLEVIDPHDTWICLVGGGPCVDFGEVKDPACKALLLATALFLNYRFFEGRAGSTKHGD
eukprot:g9132.t2